jgi:3-oxoacyl-[acyl-carrier protein] reductase
MAAETSSKSVIVTGAAQGIGKAEGWSVIAVDKNEARLAELKSEVGAHAALKIYELDVTQVTQIDGFFKWLGDEGIYPYGLVNNAGIFPGLSFLEYPQDDLLSVISVNLLGPIYMTQRFGRLLMRKSAKVSS